MMIAIPKIVVFDSATLGKVSHDYWSQDANSRDKARFFITRLKHLGIFITLTLTHISELFRHGNGQVVQNRLRFLRSLPLIAWLRPYNRQWFPGGIIDLLRRELHAVVHSSAQDWREIINEVRLELWETGTGSEMFVEDYNLWSCIQRLCKYQHEREKYVVSVDRTDPGQVRNLKVCDISDLPIRPKEERDAYMDRFALEMQKQLERHGDRRFDCSYDVSIDLANKTRQSIKDIDVKSGDIKQKLLEYQGIPKEFVSPGMTIDELSQLAVYAKRLDIISENLSPSIKLSMRDVPQNTLPSYVLERKLASIQRKADRVSGSDFGDRLIAPLVFYTDGIEVDKRTYEFLNQVRRNEPKLAPLMGRFFRSSDYSQVLKFFEE
ncbi:hypothetical protein KAR91_03395 [Candidatus Pacearchaeota archaeon]|nr:hypothetical protein [Candidatus Pacearchaeota archaeon]